MPLFELAWKVTATLTEPLLGTVSKDPEVFKKYIEQLQHDRQDAIKDNESETAPQVPPEVDEKSGWTGFHSDEKGIFVYDYLIKGALKNAGNVLKDALDLTGLRSKIDRFVFVFPRRVHIRDEKGDILKAPDGTLERPLRAQTPKGERVSLARSDTVKEGRKIEFIVKVVEGCPIKHVEQVVEKCMDYWQLCGLGQWRNASYGRVTVKVEILDPKTDQPMAAKAEKCPV